MSTYTEITLPFEVTGEKKDLLTLLADQRALVRITARNLTDEQARQRTTVSELSLGGLIKHLAWGEINTLKVLTERDENAELDMAALSHNYELLPEETLQDWLDEYERAAAELDAYIAGLDNLDDLIPQPTAPWAPERQWYTVRTMMLGKLRETAHHSGHADIIREALDGQSTMAAISEGQSWADDVAALSADS
ncbi:DinB family protein [Gordonia sp. ABSL1-1]|uniref:DinB family protein n=1 Tax=Gordonia sp. ABSL1-1 TaxID=3053923 RepID=UPI00257430D2|nr:DinB family protein [Gordonia sp. ABSL1-1]MDL9935422.1 DinB family protein [Gordonia sp. ABSL1-1]